MGTAMPSKTLVEERVERLWNAVKDFAPPKGKIDLASYSDEDWCEEYPTPDEYFLEVLTWGPYPDERQSKVAKVLLGVYREIGRPLDGLQPADVDRLVATLPLRNAKGGGQGWQQKFLRQMVSYLQQNRTSLTQVCERLKGVTPEVARAEFQAILSTNSEKIVGCFTRDYLKLDAFPIDRGVRSALKAWGIPDDSRIVEEVCTRLRIPTRVFARVVYSNAKELSRASTTGAGA